MIIIISQESDAPTIELVIKVLAKLNVTFFVIDTANLCSISFFLGRKGNEPILRVGGKNIPFSQITSVWVRRPFMMLPSNASSLDLHVQAESKALAEGLIDLFKDRGIFVLNDPHIARPAANKVVQWDVFKRLGIPIPDTQFRNTLNGIQAGKHVVKQLANKAIRANKTDFILPTKVLGKNELEKISEYPKPPLLLQRLLRVHYEVRVTIVGRKIFAARLDYDSRITQDYRLLYYKNKGISCKKHKLSPTIEHECLRILNYFGLHFGCIDIAVDKQNKHWFLELNPNGQWGWIEQETGLPIAQAIAYILTRPPNR